MMSSTVGPMHHLVGVREIADMFGVSRQRASQLGSKDDFPTPTAVLASGPIWNRSDVEEWARATGRTIVGS
jgi:prophage regulatory protein